MATLKEKLRRRIELDTICRRSEQIILTPEGAFCDWLIDLRRLLVRPDALRDIAALFWDEFARHLPFQIGAMELAGVPLMTAIQLCGLERGIAVNGFILRKERKTYGAAQRIEGTPTGDPILLVDDSVNSAESLEQARAALEFAGHALDRVFAMVDFRSPKGLAWSRRHGIPIDSLFTLQDLGLRRREPDLPKASVAAFQIHWQAALPGATHYHVVPKSAPLLVGGRIYCGSDAGTLWCVDAASGREIWRHETRHDGIKGILSAPRHYAGLIYFGGYDGNVYALDAATGAARWRYGGADWVGSTPALAPDLDLLFIGLEYRRAPGGGLAALGLSTGELAWEVPADKQLHASPAYDAAHRIVVCGTGDDCILGLEAGTGRLLWRVPTEGPVKHAPAIDPGRRLAVVACFDGFVYGLDLLTGQVRWTVKTGNILYTTPLLDGDRAYVGSTDKHFYVIDLDSGGVVKSIDCHSKLQGSPERIGEHVYFGSNDGRVYELDPARLAINGYCQLDDPVTNRIAYDPDSGHFFALTSGNRLVCFSRLPRPRRPDQDGQPRRPIAPAALARLAAETYLRDGRVLDGSRFAVGGDGRHGGVFVSIRDRRTGRRHGRGGMWFFAPSPHGLAEDIVTATIRALAQTGGFRLEDAAESWFAVALFGELRECRLGELDHASLGIVVRAKDGRGRFAGAIPNVPECANEHELYRHALANAGLSAEDPHLVYRHTVTKHLESGAHWPRFGAPCPEPWRDDPRLGAALCDRATRLFHDETTPRNGLGLAIPALTAIAVTPFADGRAGATCFAAGPTPEAGLAQAVAALTARTPPDRRDRTRLAVSLLFDRTAIGPTPEAAAGKLRLGVDALAVETADDMTILLPFSMVHLAQTAAEAARAAWQVAGRPPRADWGLLQCETWIDGRRLRTGFAAEREPPRLDRWIEDLAAAILRQVPAIDPATARHVVTLDRFDALADGEERCVVALEAVAAAGRTMNRPAWRQAAIARLAGWLRRAAADPAALDERRPAVLRAACALLAEAVQPEEPPDIADWLDPLCIALLPGNPVGASPLESLLAVRWLTARRRPATDRRRWLGPALAGLNGVFRLRTDGIDDHVAALALLRELDQPRLAPSILGAADQVLSWQTGTGLFVPAMGPLGHTAAAARLLPLLALAAGLPSADPGRYAEAARAALPALASLTVGPADSFCLPNPAAALGRVRDAQGDAAASVDSAGCLLRGLTWLAALPGRRDPS